MKGQNKLAMLQMATALGVTYEAPRKTMANFNGTQPSQGKSKAVLKRRAKNKMGRKSRALNRR